MSERLRIVCISDTHLQHAVLPIPDGDLLIHGGDFTRMGSAAEIREFDAYLATLPHEHKVVVAGNHDFLFQDDPDAARRLLRHAHYLQDAEVTVCGLRIWGSPWQPWFHSWAFNLERGPEIKAKWDLIPDGIDVLVTHGPPLGHGDRCFDGRVVGCADLMDAVRRVRPKLHVFGHIHEAYGTTREGATTFVNACTCDRQYHAAHRPIVIDWPV